MPARPLWHKAKGGALDLSSSADAHVGAAGPTLAVLAKGGDVRPVLRRDRRGHGSDVALVVAPFAPAGRVAEFLVSLVAAGGARVFQS